MTKTLTMRRWIAGAAVALGALASLAAADQSED